MVGYKWIYKIKTRSDGSIELYKVYLIAKGFTQSMGLIMKRLLLRLLVSHLFVPSQLLLLPVNGTFFQMDVKNAFLNGDLSEEVYMQPPLGLSVESNKVCHLRR